MNRIILSAIAAWIALGAVAQTLDECQQAAADNYPLIRRYDLIRSTTDLSIDNINKGWLPQVSAYAQATIQNKVVELPGALTNMMTAQGYDFKGLTKEQYKAGLDITQPIYDGGRIKSQKTIAREQGVAEQTENEVNLYGVRRRVNELYFGLLLLDDKIALNHDMQELLLSSERQLAAMVKAGTAATSDLDAVKAQRLSVRQTEVELVSQKTALTQMLALFTGKPVTALSRPAVDSPADAVNLRPELRLIDAQLRLADAREQALDAALKPTLAAFAQGYYGYPGFNMYKDMMSRTPSFNALLGVRLSWNIGALYTRANDKAKLQVQRRQAENQREVFLFNNQLETTQQRERIAKYTKLKAQDSEIIALRSSVRKAAESKLAHGIIDVNGLIQEITNENSAKIQLSTHEIEMLKEIYDLKYTLNQP